MASLVFWRHLFMAPRSRFFRPVHDASSKPCRTTARTQNNKAYTFIHDTSETLKESLVQSSTVWHGLQLGRGAVGQSFPQIEYLNHIQDAEFFGQTGTPQLLSLITHVNTCMHIDTLYFRTSLHYKKLLETYSPSSWRTTLSDCFCAWKVSEHPGKQR